MKPLIDWVADNVDKYWAHPATGYELMPDEDKATHAETGFVDLHNAAIGHIGEALAHGKSMLEQVQASFEATST